MLKKCCLFFFLRVSLLSESAICHSLQVMNYFASHVLKKCSEYGCCNSGELYSLAEWLLLVFFFYFINIFYLTQYIQNISFLYLININFFLFISFIYFYWSIVDGQRSLEGYSPWGGKESDMTHSFTQLIYNVVLISGAQRNDSVIHRCLHSFLYSFPL